MSAQKIQGIYPALITPFRADGSIDEDGLGKMTDWLASKPISGLYVGGSTAEVQMMSMAERRRVLEVVSEALDGRTNLVAQIGSIYTEDAIALAKHAERLGVDAVSALPPFYYQFSSAEQTEYFSSIATSTALPFIVYHVPALSGVSLQPSKLEALLSLPQVSAIKYTAYDLFHMQQLVAHHPEKTVINGHDEQLLSALAVGVRCSIGTTFNIMPDLYIELMDAFHAGNMDRAIQLQSKANDMIQVLVDMGIFRAVKGVLNLMGRPGGFCRKPFAPLSTEETLRLETAVLPLLT